MPFLKISKIFAFAVCMLLLASLFPKTHIVFANGGDQRVKDGYLVNFSRSPFTPIAGTKTAMLISFVDLKTGKLIKDDIKVTIRIGEGRGSETFIHSKENILVQGGVLEFSYTFKNPGLHEIFFDFIFLKDPEQKVHELPDFLIDVQKPTGEKAIDTTSFIYGIGIGAVAGLFMGWFASKKSRTF